MKMPTISSSTNPLFSPPASASVSASSSFTSLPITIVRYQQLRFQSSSSSSSSTITRAVDPETNASSDTTETKQPSAAEDDGVSFENRVAQVRLRYRSGTGKKADARKGKRSSLSSSSKTKKGGVFLPPVPLKEPVSEGLKVEFGFCPFTERLNGRLAALGLAALLLVELGSGKSLVSYHKPAVVFIQVYSIAAASAIYLKYQKEKISIWPQSSSSSSSLNNT
ncbi:uncharacterized serine-rich protein C215.13 [Macadamia integrifolia]|uniref:uncharacterized serine-rich protein C215.13 n=1 Tax=Macadamia integrifolia TaxID=60698 RepID=UPI001C4E8652|nr:uncharacterized serine-rich protein C215.13 [Macadamia integrifolia]